MFRSFSYFFPLFLKLQVTDQNKKSLKILKGQSESLNRRRTDNAMAKTKMIKGQTTIYKTIHRKLDPNNYVDCVFHLYESKYR